MAIALRTVPWPAEAKAALVALVAVPASLWLGGRFVRYRMRSLGNEARERRQVR